jgi:hypothetical protein
MRRRVDMTRRNQALGTFSATKLSANLAIKVAPTDCMNSVPMRGVPVSVTRQTVGNSRPPMTTVTANAKKVSDSLPSASSSGVESPPTPSLSGTATVTGRSRGCASESCCPPWLQSRCFAAHPANSDASPTFVRSRPFALAIPLPSPRHNFPAAL